MNPSEVEEAAQRPSRNPRPLVSQSLPDFPWDKLTSYAATARAHADGIVDLSVGTPVDPTPAVVRAALTGASDAHGYPLTWGTADLREANDEIQRFAYIVSHDLRSPLVNIMGFTSELEQLRGDIFRRIATLGRAGAPLVPADGPRAVALAVGLPGWPP